MPVRDLTDPRGVGGTKEVARWVEYFKNNTGSSIPDGDLVVIANDATNTEGDEIEISTGDDDALVIGITDAAIAAGEVGPVVVYGVKKNANVATGVTAGTAIGTSTTGGRGAAAIAGARIGVVIGATAADNKATVFVVKH